ncbi:LAGLIDADG family homing endonuclease [Bacillus sp. FSL K6-3431]|uniref:LAGLIDADG family homing endonuclease n=1 Tax=Bacillus sp. FSL K6-3431 TaxID=2921500 RepID=UPI0030FAD8E5
MSKYSRVAKNAILGDGMVRLNKTTAAITFISTDRKLLEHKEKLLNEEGLEVTVKKTQESGYGGTKVIHVYATTASEEVKQASDAGIEELIKDITKEDLFLWYLDDGSWHIHRSTMHLYSNELDESQSKLLIEKVSELYGTKPRLRIDRKQDGRQFYYLYFPRELVRKFRPDVKVYIVKHRIDTMMYKVGGKEYEEDARRFLTNDEVRNIRMLYDGGEYGLKGLADKLGHSYDQVKRVVSFNTYKNVK